MVNFKNRLLNIVVLLIIGGILLIIILSAFGVFDPGPTGDPIWGKNLGPMTVAAGSVETKWLAPDTAETPVSFQLTAAYQSGEIDSAYGLLLGEQDGSLAIGVSPLGYIAIWTQNGSENAKPEEYLLPWQPWPHGHTGQETNEILAILEDDQLRVLLNREPLWQGNISAHPDKIGVIGISFGKEVILDFDEINLYAD